MQQIWNKGMFSPFCLKNDWSDELIMIIIDYFLSMN